MSWQKIRVAVRDCLREVANPEAMFRDTSGGLDLARRSAIIGFDVRSREDNHLIGRFVGDVHLFGDHTVEDFTRRLDDEGG